MALESRLELRLSQRLILTPQLQQAIKLLQLPQLELSQFLSQELLENPFLEETADEIHLDELSPEERNSLEEEDSLEDADAPLEKLFNFTVDEYFEERGSDGRDIGYFNPGVVTPPSFEQFASKKQDLSGHLLWQLRFTSESENIKKIAEMIIGNLDENGYMIASLEEIAKASDSDTESVGKALDLVQSFDPPGIGARDLKECLLLQLAVLNLKGTVIEDIILNNIEDLEKRRYSAIAQQYNLPLKDIMDAVKIIEGLEPKPGSKYSDFNTHYITPDVYLIRNEDGYQIILNDEGLPRLKVNSFYKKLLQQNNTFQKEDKQFLIERLRSAVGLLKSLDQRNRTIYRVTETLLHMQCEFFDRGADYLKPLTLKDVASALKLHESTVSRVTSNKYLSCEHGIFSFRFLFSSALNSGLGSVSSTSVKNIIKKILIEENSRKPFSDQHITEILKKDGISIARRTVAKYREEMGIPSQAHRKKLTN